MSLVRCPRCDGSEVTVQGLSGTTQVGCWLCAGPPGSRIPERYWGWVSAELAAAYLMATEGTDRGWGGHEARREEARRLFRIFT